MVLKPWSLVLVLAASACIGAAGAIALLGWQVDDPVPDPAASAKRESPRTRAPEDAGNDRGRSASTVSRATDGAVPPSPPGNAAAQVSLWLARSADDPAIPPPHIRPDVRNARLVTIDHAGVVRAEAGDRLAFTIPQLDEDLTVMVDTVSASKWGTRSIRGHVDGDPTLGFVMTTSTRATYATVGTEAGVFNVFGNTREAWIVAGHELDRGVDPNAPHARIPRANSSESSTD